MKSIRRIAAASLALAAMAAVSTPVFASRDRVELRFGNDDNQQQEPYVQPGVIYESPAPVYRYQEENEWRQQQWRERERREHYWRNRNEWRERQWQLRRGREHERREERHPDRDHQDDWR